MKAVKHFPLAHHKIHAFLLLVGYQHCFVSDLSSLVSPTQIWPDTIYPTAEWAFQDLKRILRNPDLQLPFLLHIMA